MHSTGRLVVVSNRVADPHKPAAGGLAVALAEALSKSGGLWFGWSGRLLKPGGPAEGSVQQRQSGGVTLATLDLNRQDHDSYYLGYSNSVLWPVFHGRLDLADFNSDHIAGYRRVNRLMARALLPLLQDDDTLWVHDYHLIPLAAELRALGCRQRIGFFLHIPMPPPAIFAAIPQHEWLMRSLFAYDLLGLQSETDVAHFDRYACTEAHAQTPAAHQYAAFGAALQVQSFPIGIDVGEFERLASGSESTDMFERMRSEYKHGRMLLGIDRLDYSKGIPQRVRAFRDLLDRYPEVHSEATLVIVASPSRDSVHAYSDLREELEGLCGATNGDYGELDWVPVRYIHRMVPRERVPGLCRAACVGLVTPLRDGMNLVAKEYVVAQDPDDPGVLVLSRFAGAAEQLQEALLVNPYDAHGMADAIHRALQMPLAERKQRHQALLARIREFDVHWWRREFLSALNQCPVAEPVRATTSAPAN